MTAMVLRGYLLALLAAVTCIHAHGIIETNTIVASIPGIPKNEGPADPKVVDDAGNASDNYIMAELADAAIDSLWVSEFDSGDAGKGDDHLPSSVTGEHSTQACNETATARECDSPSIQTDEAAPTNDQTSQLQVMVAERDKEIANLQSLLQTTKAEMANVISDLNNSFQAYQKLERRIERIQKDHMKDLNETFAELEALSKESEKHERDRKLSEERCKDTQKKLKDLEFQLNEMHYNAVNQYVNFTLIGSDVYDFVQDIVTKTSRRLDKTLGRHQRRANHHRSSLKRHEKSKYTEAKIYLQSKAASAQSTLDHEWSKSTRVRPLLQQTWGKVAKYTSNVYQPYEPIVHEIKESLHLSSLSAVQEVSKGVLNYLDDHVKRKEEIEKRRREREKERARLSRHKKRPNPHAPRSRDIKITASGEVKVETTFLHKKLREIFQFTLDNSEQIVKQGTSMLPLIFTLLFGNSLIIGSFLYFFVQIPIELIWAFGIAKLACQVRKYWK